MPFGLYIIVWWTYLSRAPPEYGEGLLSPAVRRNQGRVCTDWWPLGALLWPSWKFQTLSSPQIIAFGSLNAIIQMLQLLLSKNVKKVIQK